VVFFEPRRFPPNFTMLTGIELSSIRDLLAKQAPLDLSNFMAMVHMTERTLAAIGLRRNRRKLKKNRKKIKI
jgi:hypothetical protein